MVSYSVKNGNLFLDVNGEVEEIKEPAILYDKEAGLLLKHGEKDEIKAYYDTLVSQMQKPAIGIQKQVADAFLSDCRIQTFENTSKKLVADFLNEAIATTGCINQQLAKLERHKSEKER